MRQMSTKRKTYSAEFKAKLVLEVLEGAKTINEIASSYEVYNALKSQHNPSPSFIFTSHPACLTASR